MRREFLLALGMIGIAGCATVGPISDPPYYPSNPSAVLLQHKGDIRMSANASFDGETVTGAYAISQHFGVLASGAATIHKSGDSNGNQYSGELGIGVFDTLAQSHIYEELYGGAGWGAGNAPVDKYLFFTLYDFHWPSGYIAGTENRNFWNGWMQGDAGYSNGNFSFLLMLRLEYVDLYRDVTAGALTTTYGFNNYTVSDTSYSERGTCWWFAPGLEIRYDFEPIQLFASYSITVIPAQTNWNLGMGAVGLGYKF